jgi:hypothetical protein
VQAVQNRVFPAGAGHEDRAVFPVGSGQRERAIAGQKDGFAGQRAAQAVAQRFAACRLMALDRLAEVVAAGAPLLAVEYFSSKKDLKPVLPSPYRPGLFMA